MDQLNLEGLDYWTEDQQRTAKELLIDSADVFSKDDLDLEKCNILKHDIKITGPQPFKERYRRIPPHLYEEVKTHLQEMVEVGAIRRSFNPWASAVVLVRKKDGGLRFCIDLCKLNNRTVKDGYFSTPYRGHPGLFTWCSVVFHTVPEVWLLAGGVRGGS